MRQVQVRKPKHETRVPILDTRSPSGKRRYPW